MALEINSPTHQIRSDRFAHSAATTAHVPIVIGSRVALPINTRGIGELNEFVYEAEISGGACVAEAWAYGDKIYWDAGNNRFTKTAGALPLCGFATVPKALANTVTPRFKFDTFAA